MTPKIKLKTANLIMLSALTPLVLGICWVVSVIVYAQQHQGQMGGGDAFLMIGVLLLTYTFALVVAGSSALWAWVIVRRHAELRTKSATFIRAIVGILLVAPVLWFIGINLSLL